MVWDSRRSGLGRCRLALLLCTVAACIGSLAGQAEACPTLDDDTYLLGGLFPYRWGSMKERMNHFLLAVDHVNNKTDGWWDDLLPTKRIATVVNDTACSPTLGVEMMLWQSTNCRVAATVGAACSGASKAAQMVAQVFSIPQISYSSTATELSDDSVFPFFMRTATTDAFSAKGLVALLRHFNWNSISILSVSDGVGVSLSTAVLDLAAQNGVHVLHHGIYREADPDASEEVISGVMDADDTRVVLVLSSGGGFIFDQLIAMGYLDAPSSFVFLLPDGLSTNSLFDYSDADSKRGLVGVNPQRLALLQGVWGLTPISGYGPVYDDYAALWASFQGTQQYFDQDGDYNTTNHYGPASYDAALTVMRSMHALVEAGGDPRDGAALLAAMKEQSFDGVSGQVQFDASGDRVSQPFRVVNHQPDEHGGFHVVGTFASEAEGIEWNGEPFRWPTAYGALAAGEVPIDGSCPDDCSRQGDCNHSRGTCACFAGFTAANCATPAPHDFTGDEALKFAVPCGLPVLLSHAPTTGGGAFTIALTANRDLITGTADAFVSSVSVADIAAASGGAFQASEFWTAPAGFTPSMTRALYGILRDRGGAQSSQVSAEAVAGVRQLAAVWAPKVSCPTSVSVMFTDNNEDSSSSSTLGIALGVTFGVLLLLGGVVAMAVHRRMQRVSTLGTTWKVNFDELEFGDLLGEGGFGKVYTGRWRGTEVALKVCILGDGEDIVTSIPSAASASALAPEQQSQHASLSKSMARTIRQDTNNKRSRAETKMIQEANSEALAEFIHEIEIMVQLRHPRLVQFLGASIDKPRLCLITELMSNGTLSELFDEQRKVAWPQRVQILKDVALGLNFMHQRDPPMLHLDIKSANCLLDEGLRCKVADFGLAMFANSGNTEGVGSPLWQPPEMIINAAIDTACDVFSFGILMAEVTNWRLPYIEVFIELGNRFNADSLRQRVMKGTRPAHMAPREYGLLMSKCWAANMKKRPSMNEVCKQLDVLPWREWPAAHRLADIESGRNN